MKATNLFACFLLTLGPVLPVALAAEGPTTKEEQAKLTPDKVLADLLAGNARFAANKVTTRNWQSQVKASSTGQYPKAVILSCLDSRVPVEVVFDQGIGDVFVGRVAGNIEDEGLLGSMEFATKAAGAKLVMVLGHEACGAVKGAISDVKLGNLTSLLREIKPAVKGTTGYDGRRTADDAGFVDAVIRRNVMQTVADIRKRSDVLSEMEKAGQIKIVGAYYSLQDGKVTLLD